jgi:transcriptional regulator with XRE-family HTH domain
MLRIRVGSKDNMTNHRTFAERLAESMRRKGWTQAHTAREVTRRLPEGQTFNPANLNHYLKGRSQPGLKYRQALATALDLEPGPEGFSAGRRGHASALGGQAQDGIRIEDLGGEAHVYVNKRLPWPIALKILDLLQGQG